MELLTAKEAANFLRCSHSQICTLARQGFLKWATIGKWDSKKPHRRFKKSDLIEYLDSQHPDYRKAG